MKIDVKHIADLSRITLSEEELKQFTPQMETILESVEILTTVNTDSVQPMKKHITLEKLRDDVSREGLTQEEVLKNAKYTEKGYVKIYGKIFGDIEES